MSSTTPTPDPAVAEYLERFRRDLDDRAAVLAYAAGLADEFTPAGSYPHETDPNTDPDPVRAWRFALHELHVHHVAALTEAAARAETATTGWQDWARDTDRARRALPATPRLAHPGEPWELSTVLPDCVDPGRIRHRLERAVADADAIAGAYDRHTRALRAAQHHNERALIELYRQRPTTGPDTTAPATTGEATS